MIKKYKQIVCILYLIIFSLLYAQSVQDMQKMKKEYEDYQKGTGGINKSLQSSQTVDLNQDSNQPNEIFLEAYKAEPNIDINDLRVASHFGYSFFTQRDSVAFWENLPAPANYLLGPGDELVITLWGQTQHRQTYVISREGKIYDQKVGLLNLSGKNIELAASYLKIQFGRVYSTLNGNNPSTFIDISLGKLRSINVNFVGQFNYPGLHPIHPFSSLFTAIIQSGGVDTTGSLREVKIIRDGSVFQKLDLYDYFISGVTSNIQLRDQDVILISPRYSFVQIDSAVSRPGIYESLGDETIYDMIEVAGGVTYNSSDIVAVRSTDVNSYKKYGIATKGSYITLSESKLKPAKAIDRITVNYLFKEDQTVEIIGQVKSPGSYYFSSGMTLNDLLALGGGFKDSTFIKSIVFSKAEIIRRNPFSLYDDVIPFNISDVLNNNLENPILLQNLDKVVIHENLNFFEKEYITIEGEVKIPGSYPLKYDGESLESFLQRAGGFSSKALKDGIYIFRDKKYFGNQDSFNSSKLKRVREETLSADKNKEELSQGVNIQLNERKIRVAWQNLNIALMQGDSIVVREKTKTVLVSGAIYNPGIQEFRKGKSIRYYLNRSGGLNNQGNKNSIIVLYPNGNVVPKRWYSSPKIVDGSTIIVNEKPFQEPFDITQFATNWTSIVSSVITAVILTKQL
jgi:protein involved in polysaccharide export with SLBB domain